MPLRHSVYRDGGASQDYAAGNTLNGRWSSGSLNLYGQNVAPVSGYSQDVRNSPHGWWPTPQDGLCDENSIPCSRSLPKTNGSPGMTLKGMLASSDDIVDGCEAFQIHSSGEPFTLRSVNCPRKQAVSAKSAQSLVAANAYGLEGRCKPSDRSIFRPAMESPSVFDGRTSGGGTKYCYDIIQQRLGAGAARGRYPRASFQNESAFPLRIAYRFVFQHSI